MHVPLRRDGGRAGGVAATTGRKSRTHRELLASEPLNGSKLHRGEHSFTHRFERALERYSRNPLRVPASRLVVPVDLPPDSHAQDGILAEL
jgi:hypothetical protein